MSRTHMNSSWGAIPKKSQKKYAKMDFDGDGIININDCFLLILIDSIIIIKCLMGT